ncbi:Uncharacterized fimbrial chaperone yraI Flags: Precursor [Salmonella enterica subsp. enterica]|uniref:YehC_1 protein n=1 Tax=Salmonella enterica I TaxID=59201 RepID=A0A3S4GJ01_SALET|nr:Uncharacterized fimbrial chaperone yraI Flags: Precursor [Salmonella enterica subsp. enterica]
MKKLLFFSLFFISTANAGVVIYGTRIIYPAEKNEVLVQLMNQGGVLHWFSRGLMMEIHRYHRKRLRFHFC